MKTFMDEIPKVPKSAFNDLKNAIFYFSFVYSVLRTYLNDLADLHGILGLHCRHLKGGGAGTDQVGRVLVDMVIACTKHASL